MAVPDWKETIITDIEVINDANRVFVLQFPDPVFDFKPGQFVTLDLPIHEQKNKRWRSYSIASRPDGSNKVELIISYMPGGLGTGYLFNECRVGDVIKARGPQGVFVLPEDLEEKELFLICTGTGVAPFRSMMNHIYFKNLAFSKIHLIFGCRTSKDLLYFEELRDLDESMSNFHYHPTLSREEWAGYRGYVHPIYQDLCGAKQPANFMLCGWKNMIDNAKQYILDMGYGKKDIHLELYG